jgi:N-acyl-D-aspartate/D-glutamate deacylase
MDSYTYMSDEGIQAVMDAFDDSKDSAYHLGFNRQDFQAFVMCLKHMHNSPPMDDDAEDYSEWAGQLLSSIAESLGIEFI